jgi:putative oxidoreductase
MGEKSRRILAFGLGSLLLIRGIYILVYGTGFVEEIFKDIHIPFTEYKACSPCVSSMMVGSDFIGNMFLGTSPTKTYNEYLVYISYGIYIGEVITPIFLIFGKYIRIAATIIAVDILLAMILLYRDNIFTLGEFGGWSVELPILYFMIAVSLVFSGERKETFNTKRVRKNKKR